MEEATARNYTDAIHPVREYLGHRQLQQLTEDDVEDLVDWMTSKARKRGGKPGRGLGVRSVRLTLGRLRAAANNGVPDVVVSAWAGHADLGLAKRVYIHSDPKSLKFGADKLAELLG